MRYSSGRVGVVGGQWNVDSNVGEMRVVRGDGRYEDSIYGSGFVNGMTNNAIGNCDPLFGLRFEAARALWGAIARNKCRENVGNTLGGENRVAANWECKTYKKLEGNEGKYIGDGNWNRYIWKKRDR